MKQIIGVVAGAIVAGLFLSCAPVDPPSKLKTSPNLTDPSAGIEQLNIAPATKPPGLQERIEMALEQVRQRDLLTTNGFWTVFHGILGLGPSVTLLNPDNGVRVNAVDYICDGNELRGLSFVPTKYGIDVLSTQQFVGQGHQDQFIAEMAQWGMPAQRKFVVLGKDYTFEDFIRHAKLRARTNANQELSWTVLILAQYYGTDVSWVNGHGEKLTFEDVLRYELDASVDQAACGGTHRLFGLTWAYHLHLRKDGKAEGIWQEVARKEKKYQQLAKQFQNADGSFSTSFFRERGDSTDKQLRMNTTGHTLEWLALSLSDAQLKEAWVQEAANALAMMFLDTQGQSMEGGTLYHAAHGLLIYYARVYDAAKLGRNSPPLPMKTKELLNLTIADPKPAS